MTIIKLFNRLIFCLFLISVFFVVIFFQQKGFAYYGYKDINADQSIWATNNAVAHNKAGVEFLQKGYPMHAVNEFKIAIMLNPNSAMSASIYNNLGKAYEMMKQYDLAIASYQHAIKINPDFALYYKNLVNAYRIKRILPQSQVSYEKIVSMNPQDSYAYFILGVICVEQGNNSKAIEYFKKFLELEPRVNLASSAKKYLEALEPPTMKK